MQEKYKIHRRIANIITTALSIICFMLIGWFGGMFFHDKIRLLFILKLFGCLYLASAVYFIHVVWHELGHLVFGLMTGYRFSSFRVRDTQWQRDGDGKIRRYRFHLKGTGGQCLMEPPPYRPEGKNPYFLSNFGGIAFDLILGAVALLGYFLLPDAPGLAKFLFLCFADIGFFAALVNGLPLAGLTNDGRNIYMLSRSDEAVRALYMQMNGVILLKKGVRVKDFPEEWFFMPSDEELKNSMVAVRAVYLCDRLTDQGKYQEAAALTERLLEKDAALADTHRQILKNKIIFAAVLEGDQAKADRYMDKDFVKFSKAMQSYPSILRTQYAYELLIRRDAEAAKKKLALFNKAAETFPYPAEIEAEREAIAYIDGISKSDVP